MKCESMNKLFNLFGETEQLNFPLIYKVEINWKNNIKIQSLISMWILHTCAFAHACPRTVPRSISYKCDLKMNHHEIPESPVSLHTYFSRGYPCPFLVLRHISELCFIYFFNCSRPQQQHPLFSHSHQSGCCGHVYCPEEKHWAASQRVSPDGVIRAASARTECGTSGGQEPRVNLLALTHNCGGVSVLESGHVGELLPLRATPKCLQGGV